MILIDFISLVVIVIAIYFIIVRPDIEKMLHYYILNKSKCYGLNQTILSDRSPNIDEMLTEECIGTMWINIKSIEIFVLVGRKNDNLSWIKISKNDDLQSFQKPGNR